MDCEGLFSGLKKQIAETSGNKIFVLLSFAQSIDGSIAFEKGSKTSISGDESLTFVHRLRSMFDGILVGKNTIATDNPSLTVRYAQGPNPQRIILDPSLGSSLSAKVFNDEHKRPYLFHSRQASQIAIDHFKKINCGVFPCETNRSGLSLKSMLEKAYELGLRSLMVEGGARIISSFFAEGLVDYAAVTLAPKFFFHHQTVKYNVSSEQMGTCEIPHPSYLVCGRDLVIHGKVSTKQVNCSAPPLVNFSRRQTPRRGAWNH